MAKRRAADAPAPEKETHVELDRVIGFAGFGNMGMAIAQGLVKACVLPAERIRAVDVDAGRQDAARALGFQVPEDLSALARQCDTLVLAVKPQQMADALSQLKTAFAPSTLVISIAAGLSIGFFEQHLGRDARIVRVMPNTPALVGSGAAAIALSGNCTAEDERVARTVFEAVGRVEIVPEEAMHAVTALSGSGPAYFYYLVECMRDAAIAMGLPADQAQRLAVQTAYGAGRLLAESGETPSTLRARVTSKGGTTAAAIAAFEAAGLADVVAAGMMAAARRSQELGK
jgi:pyrroline-5-carboxylate reductase